jgi:hypothetical protein
MRILPMTLLLCATTAMAGTFGNEMPLTPKAADGASQELPALSFARNGLVGLWNSGATVAGRATAKQSIAAAITLDPKPHRDGGIASIGDESYAAWVEEDWLYGQRIGSDGNPVGAQTLLQQVDSRHTMRMAIAANASEYFVVWQQSSRIVATTLDAQGNSLNWIARIVDGTYGRNIEKVAVASNGSDFLVVWEATSDVPWLTPCGLGCPSTDRDVHSVVVLPDGNPRPGTETLLATSAGMPDVVWTGSDYIAVWTGLPSGGIVTTHISAAGVPAADTQTITTSNDWGPAAAWDGSAVDVVFARLSDPTAPAQLIAVRLAADGSASALAANALLIGTFPRQFAIASDGRQTALAYTASGRIFVRYFGETPTRARAVRH